MCPLPLRGAFLSQPQPSQRSIAAAAGIIAAGATVRISRAGTAVSALASSVAFGVGALEHATGHIIRAGQFVHFVFG